VHWKGKLEGVWGGFSCIPSETCCLSAGLQSGEGALAREGGGFLLHHAVALLHLFKGYLIYANSFSRAVHEAQAPQLHPQPGVGLSQSLPEKHPGLLPAKRRWGTYLRSVRYSSGFTKQIIL